mmetsp:Transcript_26177/g.64644  ORF Transcript_26177/g.64644 Transcript_26177/m.64644 type:complete len:369 (+) Transcript_26177:277-1383(+)
MGSTATAEANAVMSGAAMYLLPPPCKDDLGTYPLDSEDSFCSLGSEDYCSRSATMEKASVDGRRRHSDSSGDFNHEESTRDAAAIESEKVSERSIKSVAQLSKEEFVAHLKQCHTALGGLQDEPGRCLACSEPINTRQGGVQTECNHWYHPLCLNKASERAGCPTQSCPMCHETAPAHSLACEIDQKVMKFVAAKHSSVLAADRSFELELDELDRKCTQMSRDIIDLASTPPFPFKKTEHCIEEIQTLLERLSALRETASDNFISFKKTARLFDRQTGSKIADDFVKRCVSVTSFARDSGELEEDEGARSRSRIDFLTRKVKAIQNAMFSTLGFGEMGPLMSRGQGQPGCRCGTAKREMLLSSRRAMD